MKFLEEKNYYKSLEKKIKEEMLSLTGNEFYPSSGRHIGSGEVESNYNFNYDFVYGDFFNFQLYHSFIPCSENPNTMYAAVTCPAD